MPEVYCLCCQLSYLVIGMCVCVLPRILLLCRWRPYLLTNCQANVPTWAACNHVFEIKITISYRIKSHCFVYCQHAESVKHVGNMEGKVFPSSSTFSFGGTRLVRTADPNIPLRLRHQPGRRWWMSTNQPYLGKKNSTHLAEMVFTGASCCAKTDGEKDHAIYLPADCKTATAPPAATPPPLAIAAVDIILAAMDPATTPVALNPAAPRSTGARATVATA